MSNAGRPNIKINKDTFEALMGIPLCTADHIAAVFNCSVPTIKRWVKEEYQVNFDHLRKQKRKGLYLKLIGKQYEVAMKGNVSMLIWLGKQYLDQKDKQEIDQNSTTAIKIEIDRDDEKA